MSHQTTTKFSPIPPEVERTGKICLDAAFKVHSALGPGLLESAYEKVLLYELTQRELPVEAQKILPLIYDNIQIDAGFRMDLLVGNCVVIELKAVERMIPLFDAQLLTYLKLSGVRLGYLINFNVTHLKNGIKRIVV